MKRLTTIAALTLTLTACAAPGGGGGGGGFWLNRDHQDPARFQADARQCEYEAMAATASAPAGTVFNMSNDIAAGFRRGELERACMAAKNYYWNQR